MGINTREIVYASNNLVVGRFTCPANNPLWSIENCTGTFPSIAFPRVAVGIKQADRDPVVATPNHVMFYNAFHPYHRQLLDPRGDECEFFCPGGELLVDVIRQLQKEGLLPLDHGDSATALFPVSHTVCGPDIYLKQRSLFRLLDAADPLEPLFVEEQYLSILGSLLVSPHTLAQKALVNDRDRCPYQLEQVAAAKSYIATKYNESLKIEDIATQVECSMFHLCRIFRRFAGMTIHRFLTQCRLRAAIERLLDTDRSLLDISLDLGFSSQSHFTSAFRNSFGISPGQFRKNPRAALN